jgi:hypothetical protein
MKSDGRTTVRGHAGGSERVRLRERRIQRRHADRRVRMPRRRVVDEPTHAGGLRRFADARDVDDRVRGVRERG